jgi:hypothetical protein
MIDKRLAKIENNVYFLATDYHRVQVLDNELKERNKMHNLK